MTDKPKKPRRTRVDSAAGVANAIVAGGKKIAVPSNITLDALQRLIFAELVEEFSLTEISPHKLRLVAGLAKDMAALQREQDSLRAEGSVLTNSHGNAIANPRAKACSTLIASILAMRRSLGIHTRQLEGGGDNRNVSLRRAHNKANEALLDNMDGDDLIARPNVVPIKRKEPVDDS